jgi:hypothetical protein
VTQAILDQLYPPQLEPQTETRLEPSFTPVWIILEL